MLVTVTTVTAVTAFPYACIRAGTRTRLAREYMSNISNLITLLEKLSQLSLSRVKGLFRSAAQLLRVVERAQDCDVGEGKADLFLQPLSVRVEHRDRDLG